MQKGKVTNAAPAEVKQALGTTSNQATKTHRSSEETNGEDMAEAEAADSAELPEAGEGPAPVQEEGQQDLHNGKPKVDLHISRIVASSSGQPDEQPLGVGLVLAPVLPPPQPLCGKCKIPIDPLRAQVTGTGPGCRRPVTSGSRRAPRL